MKFQWNLILALIFALIVAIFAVINVEPVTVNYVFGHAMWPLILVILGSVLMGGLIVGFFGIVRIYILQRRVRSLQKENDKLKIQLEEQSLKETVEVETPKIDEPNEVQEITEPKKEKE